MTKLTHVEKRNGEKELYDVSKIKLSIDHATRTTDCNPLVLESRIDQFLKAGMKTALIQQNIIQHAKSLATPEDPEWLKVAGRAYAMDMWSNYKLRGKSFLEIVLYNVRKGEYSKELLQSYTHTQIEELGKMIDHDRDLEHSHSSLVTVQKKYLGKYELNQHMHMVSAMRFGQYEPEATRIDFVKNAYDILSKRQLSLATPFMSNLRKGGNVASCFILAFEDDLGSIFENIHRIAKVSKNGGGLGLFLGYLRAKGSDVGGFTNAAGSVTQWVKIINDTLVAVNQGGKRKGAGTVALPIWHNDIFDFLDMQTEHGDLRLKSFDIFPQITIPDIYMERDAAADRWVTFCPFEVKKVLGIDVRGLYGDEFRAAYLRIEEAFDAGKLVVAKQIDNARDLTKTFMRTQFETGLPYIAFTDTINEYNPNKYDPEAYGITNVNLCTESFSNVKPDVYGHVCNLASVNLSNISTFKELAHVSRVATRMLDHGISLTNNPDPITAAHNNRYRTIGIGQMGLHDFLAKNWLTFKSLDVISKISECIEFNAASESVKMAKEFGSFEAFEYSTWKSGEQTKRFFETGCGQYDWAKLQAHIDLYGMRNSQLTSPAPTTSTSIYQDCSASVLPIFDAFFSDDNNTGSMLVAAKYLKENPIGYGKTFMKHSATEIIDAVAASMSHIDTGCSMELMFDQNQPNFDAKVVYDAIHYAWKKKIKAIYYMRTKKVNETIKQEEPACVACSG